MPRTLEAHQEVKDARRTKILAAASRVFARNGLAATKAADIAVEAEMSTGLLYHYFGGKEELFSAVVSEALRDSSTLTREALEGTGPAWPRLERVVRQLIHGMLAAPEAPLLIMQAFASEAVPAEARQAALEFGVQTHDDLTALIRLGQAEGSVVRGDPVELSLALTSCIQGLAVTRLQARSKNPHLPSADVVLRLVKA